LGELLLLFCELELLCGELELLSNELLLELVPPGEVAPPVEEPDVPKYE